MSEGGPEFPRELRVPIRLVIEQDRREGRERFFRDCRDLAQSRGVGGKSNPRREGRRQVRRPTVQGGQRERAIVVARHQVDFVPRTKEVLERTAQGLHHRVVVGGDDQRNGSTHRPAESPAGIALHRGPVEDLAARPRENGPGPANSPQDEIDGGLPSVSDRASDGFGISFGDYPLGESRNRSPPPSHPLHPCGSALVRPGRGVSPHPGEGRRGQVEDPQVPRSSAGRSFPGSVLRSVGGRATTRTSRSRTQLPTLLRCSDTSPHLGQVRDVR